MVDFVLVLLVVGPSPRLFFLGTLFGFIMILTKTNPNPEHTPKEIQTHLLTSLLRVFVTFRPSTHPKPTLSPPYATTKHTLNHHETSLIPNLNPHAACNCVNLVQTKWAATLFSKGMSF